MSTYKQPTLPVITSLTEYPLQTEPEKRSTSATRLLLNADSDNSSNNTWVPDKPGLKIDGCNSELVRYWDEGEARPYTLTLRNYWKYVDGSEVLVYHGDSFTRICETTKGISVTDSESISAELGVDVDGLSAKISAAFSHQVETSAVTSITEEHIINGPVDKTQVKIWLLYQLIDEIVALDPDQNIIPFTDHRKGDVNWDLNFPFPVVSGANLCYPNVQQTFPSQTTFPVEAIFPNPYPSVSGNQT